MTVSVRLANEQLSPNAPKDCRRSNSTHPDNLSHCRCSAKWPVRDELHAGVIANCNPPVSQDSPEMRCDPDAFVAHIGGRFGRGEAFPQRLAVRAQAPKEGNYLGVFGGPFARIIEWLEKCRD